MADSIITPEFRVSFPVVFQPKRNEMNGKDEYSVVALFSKADDLSKLRAAAMEALVTKFGADKTKWPRNLRSPFRDQAERAKNGALPEGYEEGAIFITLRTTRQPGLIDGTRQKIIDPTAFYAGCFARASVSCFAYNTKGNAGVSFGLNNIQKTKDGDPLSGRRKAEDEFEAIAGTEVGTADNPFAADSAGDNPFAS